MNVNPPDLVEQLHRAAAQQFWEEQERGRRAVEQAHREAAEQCRTEQKRLDEQIDRLHCAAAAQASPSTVLQPVVSTVHFTELPEAAPDSPLYEEWNTYRSAVGRLLREGYEGSHVLIKGPRIVGFWDTHDAAMTAGYQQFPGQSFLVHQVQEHDRVLRCITSYLCRNLRFPFCPTS